MFEYMNLYAVAAATLISVALGVIWDAIPKGAPDRAHFLMDTMRPQSGGVSAPRVLASILLHAAIFLAIAYGLALARRTDASGITVLVMSSVFMLSAYVSALVWRRMSIGEVLVRGGYALVMVWVGGLIMYYWPWN